MKDFLSARFRVRLEERMEAMGLNQAQLAARVSERSGGQMNQPRVSNLLNGKFEPSLMEVEMLAIGLNVPAGWLAFEEGRPGRLPAVSRPAAVVEDEVAPRGDRASAKRTDRSDLKGKG